jgi:hypothetical protein
MRKLTVWCVVVRMAYMADGADRPEDDEHIQGVDQRPCDLSDEP